LKQFTRFFLLFQLASLLVLAEKLDRSASLIGGARILNRRLALLM
jgi:hypothetical protein